MLVLLYLLPCISPTTFGNPLVAVVLEVQCSHPLQMLLQTYSAKTRCRWYFVPSNAHKSWCIHRLRLDSLLLFGKRKYIRLVVNDLVCRLSRTFVWQETKDLLRILIQQINGEITIDGRLEI